ncbi:MAG: transposase [Planctomycetaceae bacterium]|nr:transposase [Planctomycetaceae bacterium]
MADPQAENSSRTVLRGAFSGDRRLVGLRNPLYDRRDRLLTFVKVDCHEPTSNAGERALRHAVIWLKLSFGAQSAPGSRFVETILTVLETCRQQGRSVFDHPTPFKPKGQATNPRICDPERKRLRPGQ